MKSMQRSQATLFAVAFCAATSIAGAADITWVGGTGDWTNAANWNPPQVPSAADHVIISSGTVNAPAAATFATLDWSGGSTIIGALTVSNNAVLNITGSAILGGALTNMGTVAWSAGYIQFQNGAIVRNLGLWDMQTSQQLSRASGSPPAAFINSGTFRKSVSPGTGYIGDPNPTYNFTFSNSGQVVVQTGTLNFYIGGSLSGSYQAVAGTLLAFEGGDWVAAGPVLSGPGQIRFDGTTLTLPTDAVPGLLIAGGTLMLGPSFQGGGITNLTVGGATLIGTNQVTGVLNWQGGTLNGALTVASNGLVNISAATFLSAALTNMGTVAWSGGYIELENGAVIQNLGLWDMQTSQEIFRASGSPPAAFINSGTFRKSVSVGTGWIGDPGPFYDFLFSNSGWVVVQSGTLTFYVGGSMSGSYEADAGALIAFERGDWVAAGPTLNGAGQIRFDGTTLTLPTNTVPGLLIAGGTLILGPGFQGGSITNLIVSGATLLGTNQITGVLNWHGGTLTNALTVASNGLVNITAPTYMSGVLTNLGTVAWSGGYIELLNGAMIQNLGLWDMQASQQLLRPLASPSAAFINSGTFRKSLSSGTGLIGDANPIYDFLFSNSGQVAVQSGTLIFYGGGQLNGSYTAESTATLDFNGGNWTAVPAVTFGGPGNINFSLDSIFVAGTIQVQSGTISVLGTYSNGPSSSIAYSLGGTTRGTDYGVLQFSQPLDLKGTLSVTTRNGFHPQPGDTFQVMTYPSVNIGYGCFNGLDLGGGLLLQAQFNPTQLMLLATSYTNSSVPRLLVAPLPGAVSVQWPFGFPGWVLQSSTNLAATNWATVSNQCGNQALVPISGPRQFFRLNKTD